MAGNEQTVFHLVHPIASVGGKPIVRDEKQRFFALAHNVREQFKRTLRVVRVEISGRLVRQNHLRIIRERARNRDPRCCSPPER